MSFNLKSKVQVYFFLDMSIDKCQEVKILNSCQAVSRVSNRRAELDQILIFRKNNKKRC